MILKPSTEIKELITSISESFPSIILLCIFLIMCFVLYHTHKIGKLDWKDLITRDNSVTISQTKVLQLIGSITSTWCVIYLTIHDKLTFDILLVYLMYVGSVEGFSKYMSLKFNHTIK